MSDRSAGGPMDPESSPGTTPTGKTPTGTTPTGPDAGNRRWWAVLGVLGVVVLLAVVSAVSPAPGAAPAPAPTDGVTVPPERSFTSSAFCAAATGNAADSTIFLTNSTSRPVGGVMTSVGPSGASGSGPVRRSVLVPARGRVAVNPSAGLAGGSVASSFAFAGGGVVADQVVSGPVGWSMAPCATQVSSSWSFAGGSTATGDSLALALYNPAAPDAVVNVSFVTGSGLVTPEPYQGLIVPPGGLMVEHIGSYVQNVAAIGTVVSVQSGNLVSTEFQQSSQGSGGVSLRLGAPSLSPVWRFAQTILRPGGRVEFDLANPGDSTVTATLSLGLSEGSVVPRRITIPPLSIVDYAAAGPGGLPQQTAFSTTIEASAPIVVGRTVVAAHGAPQPGWGSSSGTMTLSAHWLVPSPGVPAVPGTAGATVSSLAVANPGPSPDRVRVASLDGARPTTVFTLAAGGVVVLGPRAVGGLHVLSVDSTGPVFVEEDAAPTGAPGVVSSTGFPLAGP